MRYPRASWFDPDKIIKDILWNDMAIAAGFAKDDLLDIGCRNKPYQQLFQNRIKHYIGIDAHSSQADIRKDFFTAKIPQRSFNTILSTQVLEHVPDPTLFLQKNHTLLKPKGVVIITALLMASLHEEPNDY